MPRTSVLVTDHIDGLIDHLDTYLAALSFPVPIGFGERPVDDEKQFHPPPYVVITYIPGGDLEGPLADSQADINLRVLVNAMGNTAHEASVLRDIVHTQMMDKSNFSITNRKIRSIGNEVASDGLERDDDAPTPIHYTRQIYILDTVPT